MKYEAQAKGSKVIVTISEKKFFNKGKVLKALSTLSKQNLIIFDDSKKTTVFEISLPVIDEKAGGGYLEETGDVSRKCPTKIYFKPVVDKLKKIGDELGKIDGSLSAVNLMNAVNKDDRSSAIAAAMREGSFGGNSVWIDTKNF